DSPLQMVNTITGTSRATIHLIKRRRVSRSGKNVRELTDVDTLASPRFQQAMITTLKHARLLYTFSGVCEPRRPEGRKTRIKMSTAKMTAPCHAAPPCGRPRPWLAGTVES